MLVDTSVWLEFLAPKSRLLPQEDIAALKAAIVAGDVVTVMPIYGELISGAKHGDLELRRLLGTLRFVDLDWNERASWDDVAGLGEQAHRRHLRIPGVVDRMILAAALAANEPLWALDGALLRLARALGIAAR